MSDPDEPIINYISQDYLARVMAAYEFAVDCKMLEFEAEQITRKAAGGDA